MEGAAPVDQMCQESVRVKRATLKRMKNGKAVNDIPLEVWKC